MEEFGGSSDSTPDPAGVESTALDLLAGFKGTTSRGGKSRKDEEKEGTGVKEDMGGKESAPMLLLNQSPS